MTTTETAPRVVKLGNVVRDPVTGFTGTATQYVELLNGTVQFAVQPACGPNEPNKLPDAYSFDIHLLEFVEEGMEAKVTPPSPDVKIKLGDRVRDTITKLEGVTTQKTVFVNGCTYFSVQAERTDSKAVEPPKPLFISHDRLELIVPAVPTPRPAPVASTRAPGGPTTLAPRI